MSLNLQIIAFAIVTGVLLHAGNHLICDFPHMVNSSPELFASIASDFNNIQPTYKDLLTSIIGVTGISMVILMAIAFTLATRQFRKSIVKLPAPFNRLTGFNAFWYSHHLLGLVYALLLIHGNFLFLVHRWYQKTVRALTMRKYAECTLYEVPQEYKNFWWHVPNCLNWLMTLVADMDVHICSSFPLFRRTEPENLSIRT